MIVSLTISFYANRQANVFQLIFSFYGVILCYSKQDAKQFKQTYWNKWRKITIHCLPVCIMSVKDSWYSRKRKTALWLKINITVLSYVRGRKYFLNQCGQNKIYVKWNWGYIKVHIFSLNISSFNLNQWVSSANYTAAQVVIQATSRGMHDIYFEPYIYICCHCCQCHLYLIFFNIVFCFHRFRVLTNCEIGSFCRTRLELLGSSSLTPSGTDSLLNYILETKSGQDKTKILSYQPRKKHEL